MPLTNILKGEIGSVSKHMSKKVSVKFTKTQRISFDRLRTISALEDVMLIYSDFKKPFDLTMMIQHAIYLAVLSQEGRLSSIISHIWKEAESHYATNKRDYATVLHVLFANFKICLWYKPYFRSFG